MSLIFQDTFANLVYLIIHT